MLRYRSKCVKTNTQVKHKGYLSDHGQTLSPVQLDFRSAIFAQEFTAFNEPRVVLEACVITVTQGRIGGDTRRTIQACSERGPLASFMYTQPVSAGRLTSRTESEPRSPWLQ
jgi:hypothetical protein